MPGNQLGIYLYNHGCEVMLVRSNHFCFLNAIDMVLYCKYNEVVTVNSLASIILGHLAGNVNYYEWFHKGDILRDTRATSN